MMMIVMVVIVMMMGIYVIYAIFIANVVFTVIVDISITIRMIFQ